MVGPINKAENFNVIQPCILKHGPDTLQALCRSKENYIVGSWSYDAGKSWSELKALELPNPNSGIDAVTLKNGLHVLVYNHSMKEEGKWGGPRTPLNVSLSADGINWEMVMALENQPGEFSYPAIIQASSGNIHIVYTWKRDKIKHVVLDPEKLDKNYIKQSN